MKSTEIYAGLWQGGWPTPGEWLASQGFSTLVLCAHEYQPPRVFPSMIAAQPGLRDADPWPGVEVIYAPLDDDFEEPPPRDVLRGAVYAGRMVAQRLAERSKVLVTCWQGRNRSGLVSAIGLHLHLGISGKAAARIVQTRRKGALRNPQFCALLDGLQAPVARHLHQAVATKPSPKQAHLHSVPAFGASELGFTLPPGVL